MTSITGTLARGLVAAVLVLAMPQGAAAQEGYIGQLRAVSFDFCPRGWMKADGQILQIVQYQALYSLLGNNFGGDGRTSFALPDMRGRAAVGIGTGPGLTPVAIAQKGGQEQVTLSPSEMPQHGHSIAAQSATANAASPVNNAFATFGGTSGGASLYATGTPDVQLNPAAIAPSGGSQPHPNRDPYLAVTWCISTQGLFPSRP